MTGLTNGTAYTFTVTATNGVGTGPPGGPVQQRDPRGRAGGAGSVDRHGGRPLGPRELVTRDGWRQPDPFYTVHADHGGQAMRTNGAGTQLHVAGLTNGDTYSFTVTATNAAGTGPRVAAVQRRDARPTCPERRRGDRARRRRAGRRHWSPPASDGGSRDHELQGRRRLPGRPGHAPPTTAPLSRTVAGLTNGNTYTFTVTATNAIGTGPAPRRRNSVTPVAAATAPGPTSVSADGRQRWPS